MNEKTIQKNIPVFEEHACFPTQMLGNAILNIIASPPSIDDVNVLLSKNMTPKLQRKFNFTQKDLEKFNNLKNIFNIPYDYQMIYVILNKCQQNPLFKF
ncbi:MAG: hypothetical protein DI628_00520 [Blastochloris viridis]|uniref:Uncharacterized protein n=1 Tax=Blastochloris viridis TaxID=1079 RepID=A0A6N4RBN9_BLAVI|nr:MAG: hypothetical protein DI628_00520 [Blastochloris viridis]